MIANGTRTEWTQTGWVEFSPVYQLGTQRQVFHYDTMHGGWELYPYPLQDGSSYFFWILQESAPTDPDQWDSFLWWNDEWNLLESAVLGWHAGRAIEALEVTVAQGSTQNPPAALPNVPLLANSDTAWLEQPFEIWQQWDTTVPTDLVINEIGPCYCSAFPSPYSDWRVDTCF